MREGAKDTKGGGAGCGRGGVRGVKKRENQGEKGGCGRWERGVRKIGKAGRESKVDVAFSGKGSARGWNKDRVAPFFKILALPFLAFALAPAKRYEHLAGFVQRLTCGANYNGR